MMLLSFLVPYMTASQMSFCDHMLLLTDMSKKELSWSFCQVKLNLAEIGGVRETAGQYDFWIATSFGHRC